MMHESMQTHYRSQLFKLNLLLHVFILWVSWAYFDLIIMNVTSELPKFSKFPSTFYFFFIKNKQFLS